MKVLSNIKKIKLIKAEIDELIKPEIDIQNRINENFKACYKFEETDEDAQQEIKKWEPQIKEVTKMLQLKPAEIEIFDERLHVDLVINPCAIPANSPTYRCEFTAIKMDDRQWTYGLARTECNHNPAYQANMIDAKCAAYGYGKLGKSYGRIWAYAWFYFYPHYPTPRWILVKPRFHLHGFYYLAGTSSAVLIATSRGYQDGYFRGGAIKYPLIETAPASDRYDATIETEFWMPVQAKPFIVMAGVELRARAKGVGSLAYIDFSSGPGNYIKIPWVNTSSPF